MNFHNENGAHIWFVSTRTSWISSPFIYEPKIVPQFHIICWYEIPFPFSEKKSLNSRYAHSVGAQMFNSRSSIHSHYTDLDISSCGFKLISNNFHLFKSQLSLWVSGYCWIWDLKIFDSNNDDDLYHRKFKSSLRALILIWNSTKRIFKESVTSLDSVKLTLNDGTAFRSGKKS